MKIMKKFLYLIYFCLVSLTVVLFMQVSFYTVVIPDNFYREKTDISGFTLGAYPNVSVVNEGGSIAVSTGEKNVYDMNTAEWKELTVFVPPLRRAAL